MKETGGKLGNQLFQYAVCKSVALKNGYEYCIPKDFLGISQLKLNCDLGVSNFTCKNVYDQHTENLQKDIFNISDFTLINGFFQSEYYFEDIKDIIKNDFTLVYDVKSENLLKKFDVEEYCYIHLRGSDYKNIDWLLPKEYWLKAKCEMNNIKKNIKFLVITDDIDYSKQIFPEEECISNDIFTDFYLLSKSKYAIISNSSFSWWAIYLNNNSNYIIGPKRWFNYNKLQRFEKYGETIPEGIEQLKIIYI